MNEGALNSGQEPRGAPGRAALTAGAGALYLLLFIVLFPAVGAIAAAFYAIPVLAAACYFSLRIGLVVSLAAYPVNVLAATLVGPWAPWNPSFVVAALVNLLVAVTVGALRDGRFLASSDPREHSLTATPPVDETQTRLELAGQGTDHVLWDWDLRNNHLWFGQGLLPSFGYDPKTVTFDIAAWIEKVHPDERHGVKEGIRDLVEGRQDHWSGEYRVLTRNGDWADVVDRAWVVKDAEGHPVRITGAKMNVTASHESARQATEIQRLEAQNRFRRDFLSAAAHDIATPLTPLRLQLHVLEAADPSTPLGSVAKNVQILKRNVERLAHFVDELLEAARLESHRLEIRKAPVKLEALAEAAVDNFRPLAEEKGLRIRISGLPVMVNADEGRLMRVVTNLVSNAIKFTPKAGEDIRLTWGCSSTEAYLIVADAGVGMTTQEAARLFQPFARLQNANESAGGTGLGLYISRGILQAHGGRITVNSAGPGRGSTFSIFLPLPSAERAVAQPAPLIAARS